MFVTQPRVRNASATDDSEKLDNMEELRQRQPSNSPLHLEIDPPDSGFQAWVTVFGCFLMQFCGFGYSASFGVYQDFYTRIYLHNYSPTAISCIGALTSFLTMSIALISGPLYDRGWFYHLMIVGSLLQSLSLFILSLAKPDQFCLVFMAQGVLAGCGMGLTYAPSVAVISQHFSKRRTLAMSLATSGTPLGAIIHPVMLNHLLNSHIGFSKSVLVSASFVSVLLLISCLTMRTKALPIASASYSTVARKCSREILFILMTTGAMLFQIGFYFPVFYLQLDSVKHGITDNFSFYSIVIMNAANFIGRCTAGIFAPYTGVLNLMIVATIACSVVIIAMIALSDIASVAVISIIYGYFSGVYIALLVPLFTVVTPNLSELGARIGICFAFAAFSGLVGGPISGALLSNKYRWWIPSLFNGLTSLVGGLLYVVMGLIIYLQGRK